ncbi:MAG TPA: hypothetical protein PKD70_13000 [Saprospiraceae bacterium]|nr:hypothetical protein [Saprospiraceae bacterium]HMP14789.1 hypothetical protein [Saprospiraceae bacterium]
MKTPSADLFQLIRSLTRQEKRYFKLYATRHAIDGHNKYVLLFDAIDRQLVYNEPALREQFKDEPFIRQLHVAKNYLYQNILNSLRHFHESRSEDRFLIEMRHAALLFNKGLYEQSEKALAKAKRLAFENEHFLQLLEVYRWEHQIAHSRNDAEALERYIQTGLPEEMDLIEKYRNFLAFQALNDQVFIPYWRKGAIRNELEKTNLRQLFEKPLFQNAEHAQSFNARYFYYNARFSYHFFIGELSDSYEYVQQLVALFEKLEPARIKGKLVRYFSSALINLYIVQQRLGLFEAIPQTLAKLREMPTESPDQKRRLFVRSFNLEVDLYLSTGQFVKGVQQIADLEQRFEQYRDAVDKQQRLGLYYNLAYLYFGAQQYNHALDWINLLLQDPELKTREDIHCFGRILNLIIHYELGNDQLLEYAVESTSRFLSRRQRLFQVEAIMLKLIRKYPKWLTIKEKEKGFQNLLNEMRQLKKDEFERRAFEYFDFIAWLESKLQALKA